MATNHDRVALPMTSYPRLFAPISLNGVELRNRIVQTGHVTGMAYTHLPGPELLAYYKERARGGVALIISEAGSIHPTARHMSSVIQLYDERIVPAYRTVAHELHALGCRFVAQLWHSGSNTDGISTEREPWAPSPIAGVLNHEIAHEVSQREIRELIDAYAGSTARAVAGNADGVELHAGHGYIPQQFMSQVTNKRTDEYGGSFENRLRFTTEVLDAVAEALGPQKILGLRISAVEGVPGGLELEENIEIARRLVATGRITYLSVTYGNYSNMQQQIAPMGTPLGYLAHYAGALREAVPGVPVLAVGRITSPELAEQILAEGQADLIGMTRQLMADPEFANKAQQGQADRIRPCVGTNYCMSRMWAGRQVSCIYNPATGRELELGAETLTPAATPRRVTVVGGGPAGLEAARVAALRGHTVTLYEREDELGGQLRLARRVASRRELGLIADYLAREVDRLGVAVRLGVEATRETLAGAEAVVVATGSRTRALGFNHARADRDRIPGIESTHALSARDVLQDGAGLGRRVIVSDPEGHVQGLAIVEHLLDTGHEVELVTQHAAAGSKIGGSAWMRLIEDCIRKGATLTTLSIVDRIEGARVTVTDVFGAWPRLREGVDAVVVVGDAVAEDALARDLLERPGGLAYVVTVGDCLAPRHLDMAVLEGHRAGRAV